MMRNVLIAVGLLLATAACGQTSYPLYKGKPPGNLDIKEQEEFVAKPGARPYVTKVSQPTLKVFLPAGPGKHAAAIICPGGGYSRLSIIDGGEETAKELADSGMVALVLKYRTTIDGGYDDYSKIPMADLEQAYGMAYAKADEWHIDTARIGVMGFSAGGHLAAMNAVKGMHRPKFNLLIYPIISFQDSLTAPKSATRNNLVGRQVSQAVKDTWSPELWVTAHTAPAFLVQASNDSTSLVGNSISYYLSLMHHHVPAEMLIYQKGGHGFARYNEEQHEYWMPLAIRWLRLNGMLDPQK